MSRSLTKYFLTAFIALSPISAAWSSDVNLDEEVMRLSKLSFQSMDESGRGIVDMGQFYNQGTQVFASMDADDSGKISIEEFLSWDVGVKPIATELGRSEAFEAALKVVFAFWDRNGDGQVSASEHRKSLITDFERADASGDAVLTEEEFLMGFTVMLAIRAALKQ